MARSDAGHHVGQRLDLIERYTAAAKRAVGIPVVAKLTPNITDMIPSALSAQEGGADAVSAINTLKSISHVDVYSLRAQPTDAFGHSAVSGYSGQGARPIGLRFVSELGREKRLHIPISGMGGIYTWKHAVEYLSVGASNLQVTTAVMQHGTRVVEDMVDGLERYLKGNGFSSVLDVVGKANKSLVDPSQLDAASEVVSVIDLEKCIGCGRCEIACRDGAAHAIGMKQQQNVSKVSGCGGGSTAKTVASVDKSLCFGCKLCQFVCPVDAISFEVRSRIDRPRFSK
jgi:dihydropyrimidine dehydrogenase (NAD+) subunit PreA